MNKTHYWGLSWLGPPLFLMYFNDITDILKSNIKLIAVDTAFFGIANNQNDGARDLTHDLPLISKWDFNWKILFNLEPTKYFFICYSKLKRVSAQSFSKIMQLKAYISIYKHDFICLSARYLDSSKPLNDISLQIESYNLAQVDHRNNVKRGGACTY